MSKDKKKIIMKEMDVPGADFLREPPQYNRTYRNMGSDVEWWVEARDNNVDVLVKDPDGIDIDVFRFSYFQAEKLLSTLRYLLEERKIQDE
jgi:hypothetical protein